MTMLRKFALDVLLLALSIACAGVMFVASSDPLLEILKGTSAQDFLSQFTTGNQIAFDLAVGLLAGVFMYYLVVRLPEYEKRRRLRGHLGSTYKSFKEECISVYLSCFMPSYPSELPHELLDRNTFKTFFKEHHMSGQTKWDAVANGLNDDRIKSLIVELELLHQEIQFTLGAIDVRDKKAFNFFKSLSRVLYRSKNWTADYDHIKSMLGFMWSLHTGWNWASGYAEEDPVEKMINAI
jgi:hypothetical protein